MQNTEPLYAGDLEDAFKHRNLAVLNQAFKIREMFVPRHGVLPPAIADYDFADSFANVMDWPEMDALFVRERLPEHESS